MKKLVFIMALMALGWMMFQPGARSTWLAQAQEAGTPDPYIGALGTQAALNTRATLAAFQQQQNAFAAQAAAARAQAQAAAMKAQAAAAAQQATWQAGQQQAAIVSAQSTADAAALQATAIVQQTRTALEISAQQTQTAGDVRATETSQALQVKATQAALEQTRVSSEAKRHDDEAIATSVAIGLQATKTAIDAQAINEQRAGEQSWARVSIGNTILIALFVISGVLATFIIGKFFRVLWRSRALNPTPAPLPAAPIIAQASSASHSIVDAATGNVGRRMAVIEHNDDPQALTDLLRSIYGR